RIPSICAFRENVEAGAVMSYGVDLVGLFRDAADVVDQIAKGANPAELPILQSSRFHLAINLKSATELGINLPVAFTALAAAVLEGDGATSSRCSAARRRGRSRRARSMGAADKMRGRNDIAAAPIQPAHRLESSCYAVALSRLGDAASGET